MARQRRSSKDSGRREAPGRPRPGSRNTPSAAAFVPLLLVLAALFVVYLPVLRGQFLQWDDFKTIAANPSLNPPTFSSVMRYWDPRRPYMDLYVPVTYTAWAMVASVAGTSAPPATPQAARSSRLDPAAFHGASLAVHAIATIFAFLILRRLLAAHRIPETRAGWAAAIGAGLFALHPLQVESAAWASGLKDLLAGAFTLAALWLFLGFLESPGVGDAKSSLSSGGAASGEAAPSGWAARALRDIARALAAPTFLLATLAFVLAMLSKPSAVVAPALAACLALVLPARTGSAAPTAGAAHPPASLRARLAGLAPALAPLAIWALLALPVMAVARRAQPAASGFDSPLWARPLVALDALAFYAYKLVVPVRLAMDYGRSPDGLAVTPWIWCTWIVPVAIAAAVFLARRRAPWLAPAALFSVSALFTVLGLLRFDFQSHSTVADHYVYVALLGPALALAFLASSRPPDRILIVGGLVLIPLGTLARAQTAVWHDSAALFTHTLDVNPRSVAGHINLGHLLYMQGRTEEAIRHDEAALETRPHEPEAHNNLGNALLRLKRPAEAAEHFRAALAVNPDSVGSHFNLGLALSDLGDKAGAAREYEETLRLAPHHAAAITNLAEIDLDAGEYEKAAEGYRRALAIDPALAPARRGLANALARRRGAGVYDGRSETAGPGEPGDEAGRRSRSEAAGAGVPGDPGESP